MSDLVERFRKPPKTIMGQEDKALRIEAADEIARLQEENKLIERALQNAEAIIERLRERDVK